MEIEPKWQAALRLKSEGLSNAEIAARIGSTAGSVRSLLRQYKDPEAWRKANREVSRRIRATPEGAEANREASRGGHRRIRSTAEGREKVRRLRSTPEGRAKHNEASRAAHRRHLATPGGRTASRIRSRTYKVFRHLATGKPAKTFELFGCTPSEAKARIESTFWPGMSWENYGEWHIDHIVPVSAFDPTDPEHVRQCFSLDNLQALWAADNLSKGGVRR
jgi:hypothetical protein